MVKVAKGNAVGGVGTLEIARQLRPPIVARVIALEERAVTEKGKVSRSLADNADLIPVLEVSTNT